MRRLFLAIAIIVFAIPLSTALAQPILELDRVTVEIWPEYDRPSAQVALPNALVIYRITLKAQTTMPAQVSLRIPKEAGQPYNLANLDVDNQLYTIVFTTVSEGDWIRVNFTTPTPNVQLEYYDPRLVVNGAAHSLEYKWAGDYKVNSMTFKVQKPPSASDMAITPTQGTVSQEDGGLTYYTSNVGPVDAGTGFTFKVGYTKNDTTLTADGLIQLTPIPTNPASSAGKPGDSTTLLFLGLGVGAVLLIGGLVWFIFQRRAGSQSAQNSYRRHSGGASTHTWQQEGTPSTSAEGVVYCHQCGKRAQTGDTFCRSCGTRLRVE
jgi:hypothetical protein